MWGDVLANQSRSPDDLVARRCGGGWGVYGKAGFFSVRCYVYEPRSTVVTTHRLDGRNLSPTLIDVNVWREGGGTGNAILCNGPAYHAHVKGFLAEIFRLRDGGARGPGIIDRAGVLHLIKCGLDYRALDNYTPSAGCVVVALQAQKQATRKGDGS